MVTILPIDVDEELVREGLALAVAERVRSAAKLLIEQANELASAGFIERGKWDRTFALLAEIRDTTTPTLEYAKVFADQWADEAEGDAQ